jgi:phosphatidylserine/phosphatidylglycerophosphate/cardiolipin synthase-like enzyme
VGDDRLLTPGQTCWRAARADQFACIIDAADYFKHVKAAMLRARHRIMLIGWDFDARVTFERGVKTLPGPNRLGAFLYWMLWKRPALDVYLLKSIQVLWAADEHRRLGIYWPETDGGAPIYVHSKVMVVDDRLLRIGSSNLNNRSMGFDSECDVAIEADSNSQEHDDVRRQISCVQDQLVSEHLGGVRR